MIATIGGLCRAVRFSFWLLQIILLHVGMERRVIPSFRSVPIIKPVYWAGITLELQISELVRTNRLL